MPGIGRGPLEIRVQGGLEEGTGRHAKADATSVVGTQLGDFLLASEYRKQHKTILLSTPGTCVLCNRLTEGGSGKKPGGAPPHKRVTLSETAKIPHPSTSTRNPDKRHRQNPSLLYLKVHGSLARAGKVKSATPKVEKQEKPKSPKGRARKRLVYTRRFVNVTLTGGKRKMNANPTQ
ncbi:40S ribosomal protein S30-B [Aspergillus awamori]|uniref:40S ribosomal protein S30-B n=1 Tax=Aspergillus awamori TaxID=105351 RepID=A0A401KM12_ASPAW|nr:40S ribosomal protein S30-B [Aspergillus awamori]